MSLKSRIEEKEMEGKWEYWFPHSWGCIAPVLNSHSVPSAGDLPWLNSTTPDFNLRPATMFTLIFLTLKRFCGCWTLPTSSYWEPRQFKGKWIASAPKHFNKSNQQPDLLSNDEKKIESRVL